MFRRIWNRIFTHTRKRKLEREMEAEMRFHLDMENVIDSCRFYQNAEEYSNP